ncbi:MAG: hypothetical protein AB7F43_06985 [Bacteriovoracia bacterium]
MASLLCHLRDGGGLVRFGRGPNWQPLLFILGAILVGLVVLVGLSPEVMAAGSLPGSDESAKLTAAGTLLRIVDTGLFKWGARIFAGLCIMSAAWALKEQRFGVAVICIVGAIIFGTAPKWVKNIFDIGGGDSVFAYQINLEQIKRPLLVKEAHIASV